MAFSLGGLVGAGTDCGCCTSPDISCGPCDIPAGSLNVTIKNATGGTVFSFPVAYDSTHQTWGGFTLDVATGFIVSMSLSCQFGLWEVEFTYGGPPNYDCIWTGYTSTGDTFDSTALRFVDLTCNPLHIHLRSTVNSCPAARNINQTDFYIDE